MTTPDIVRYVLMVVLDPSTGFCVGITKLKGPEHLHGKLTFPGGKVEPGEHPVMAASREMLEETGVEIPTGAWRVFDKVHGKDFELTKLVAVSDQVLSARKLEDEPVWHLAYSRHLEYAARNPNAYVHDFIDCLQGAFKALELEAVAEPLPA